MADTAELTVESAADAFAGLLSAEGGTQEPEKDGADKVEGEAGEESEGETETEAEESDDAEQDEEAEEEPSYTVKIDGKDATVPLKELLSGYQRTADYTRKTQELSERRKSADTELETAKAARENYAEMLDKVKAMVEQNAPKEPDWDTLLQQNPTDFVRQRFLFDKHQRAMAEVETQRAQVEQARKAEESKATAEYVAEQSSKLLEAIPDWKDAKKASTEKAKLVEHGATYGYSPEELAEVTDHRAVMVLRDAMRFRDLQAKLGTLKPNVQQPAVKTVRGGNASQTPANDLSRAMKRLAQTGDQNDAAAVFKHFV